MAALRKSKAGLLEEQDIIEFELGLDEMRYGAEAEAED